MSDRAAAERILPLLLTYVARANAEGRMEGMEQAAQAQCSGCAGVADYDPTPKPSHGGFYHATTGDPPGPTRYCSASLIRALAAERWKP